MTVAALSVVLLGAPRWTYEVTAAAASLAAEAKFPPGSGEEFEVEALARVPAAITAAP